MLPNGGQIVLQSRILHQHTIHGRRHRLVATIKVIDNGPGIPVAQQARVFDRFYRMGGDRHSSQTPGCGLGLSIVQQVVELHAAHIALTQSRFDQGLLVMVTFAACSLPGSTTTFESAPSRVSHHEQNR